MSGAGRGNVYRQARQQVVDWILYFDYIVHLRYCMRTRVLSIVRVVVVHTYIYVHTYIHTYRQTYIRFVVTCELRPCRVKRAAAIVELFSNIYEA